MFWNQFYQLCKESGKSPTKVVEQLGIARGSITKWKGGSLPSGKNLSKIANYFNVPVDRLLSPEEKETAKPTEISDDLWDALRADSQKKQLAIWLTQLPDSEFERVKQLLGAALLLPPE